MEALNTVTDDEYVLLSATFEILYDETQSFNCYKCINELCKNGDGIRKARACEEIRDVPVLPIRNNIANIEFFTCPGNFYDKYAEWLIFQFQDYKKGMMRTNDLPAKIVEIFRLLYSLESNHYNEKAKRAKDQQGRTSSPTKSR